LQVVLPAQDGIILLHPVNHAFLIGPLKLDVQDEPFACLGLYDANKIRLFFKGHLNLVL
jgi:hypothetical protein